MFYYLLKYINEFYSVPGFGVFRYITFRVALATISALIFSFWLGPKIISKLKERQIGELEKTEAPKTHKQKAGTPTMGGIIILSATIIPSILWSDILNSYVILILFVAISLGIVGFIDDYLKVVKKKPKGLIERDKLIGQFIVGSVLGISVYFFPEIFDKNLPSIKSSTVVPFLKNTFLDFGYFYIPFVIFIITASSNAVNLTDGLDGLASGTVGIAATSLMVISYLTGNFITSKYLFLPFLNQSAELTIFCSALVGASIGFLWFNSHPAEIFMGDTGSLALGGSIGALCIMLKQEFLLPVIGGVFFIETLSVLIQRYYFKYTKKKYGEGKRIFKMAPLHHHFEMVGWSEPKIVTRFYIIAILLMIFSLASLKLR